MMKSGNIHTGEKEEGGVMLLSCEPLWLACLGSEEKGKKRRIREKLRKPDGNERQKRTHVLS